jgi:hypothetical protein
VSSSHAESRAAIPGRPLPLFERGPLTGEPAVRADSSKNAEPAHQRCSHPFPGGHSGVVPPDPIPNSEVKRACADGSVALPCKSRSPPGALSQKPPPETVGVFSWRRCGGDRSSRPATGHRQSPKARLRQGWLSSIAYDGQMLRLPSGARGVSHCSSTSKRAAGHAGTGQRC